MKVDILTLESAYFTKAQRRKGLYNNILFLGGLAPLRDKIHHLILSHA